MRKASRRCSLTACRLMILAAMLTISSQCHAGEKLALLIGIDQYAKGSGLKDLQFASKDAEDLATVLIESGYRAENVHLLSSGSGQENTLPTRSNIVAAVRRLTDSSLRSKEDTLLVVFAGHGFNSGGESYLCPLDYDAENPEASAFRVAELGQMLAESPAREKYVLIDACRNELVRDQEREFNLLMGLRLMHRSEDHAPQGIVFFSSCLAGQQSYEDAGLQHGVFMNYVIEAIRGYADHWGNFDGKVSAFEVIEYASEKTMQYVQEKFDDTQRPWADSHSTTDLCLAELSQETWDRLKAELGTIERVDPLEAIRRQQAEDLVYDSLFPLIDRDFAGAMRRLTEAVEVHGEYYMARRLRSLLFVIEGNTNSREAARLYQSAIDEMAAVGSSLRVPLPSDSSAVEVRTSEGVVTTAAPGDVLKVTKVTQHGNQHWLRVEAVKRRLTTEEESGQLEELVGYVELTKLANPSANRAQFEDLGRSRKPTSAELRNMNSRSGSYDRLSAAERDLNTTTAILSQIPGARQAAPWTGLAGGIVGQVRRSRFGR